MDRAEAAEARTAVKRDEVWRVVAAHDPGDDEMALCRVNRLTDAVWSLVSGSDPDPPVSPRTFSIRRRAISEPGTTVMRAAQPAVRAGQGHPSGKG